MWKTKRKQSNAAEDSQCAHITGNLRVMNDETQARIKRIIQPFVDEAGLFLEEVRLVKAGRHTSLQVTLDLLEGSGGIDSTTLGNVSRTISKAMDDADPIAGAYNLEVSTPGATRPLREARHFSRATDRLVAFKLTDGTQFEGRIIGVDGDTIHADVDGEAREISLTDIKTAQVVLEMKKA